MLRKINADYLRNLLFGAEDSLVSTVGVLFGLSSSPDYNSRLLILAGITLIAVEALSMGVGSYLSEVEVHETKDGRKHIDSPIIDGIIMLISYLIFGVITLAPYLLFPISVAKYFSVVITLGFLFIVGYLPTENIRSGIRMLVTAGLAICVGFLVANIF